MLAIDTNIIVRALVGDDPEQALKAQALISAEDVFVADTVLLETEWVLRSAYHFSVEEVVTALRGFAGLLHVHFDQPAVVAAALNAAQHGMDFADALHLSKSSGCEAMVTFDQRFIKAAAHGRMMPVRLP